MTQDPTAKLLYEFLQMTDHIAPQKFLERTAMVAAKDAQSQAAIREQAFYEQLCSDHLSLEQEFERQKAAMWQRSQQQVRDYEQQIQQQKTAYERLRSDYVTLKQEFDKQRAGMQQLSAQYKLLLDRHGNR